MEVSFVAFKKQLTADLEELSAKKKRAGLRYTRSKTAGCLRRLGSLATTDTSIRRWPRRDSSWCIETTDKCDLPYNRKNGAVTKMRCPPSPKTPPSTPILERHLTAVYHLDKLSFQPGYNPPPNATNREQRGLWCDPRETTYDNFSPDPTWQSMMADRKPKMKLVVSVPNAETSTQELPILLSYQHRT